MGQTVNGNAGNLELLKKIEEQGEKLGNIRYVKKTSFQSAWDDSNIENFYVIDINSASDIPSELRANRCFGFQWKNNEQNYGFQTAFSFGADKIAIRRIENGIWSNWAYFVDKSYVDDKIRLIETGEISFQTSPTMGYTNYDIDIPSGYKEVSREFVRLDTGSYNVITSLPIGRNYIVHMGASSFNVKCKVRVLCIKIG